MTLPTDSGERKLAPIQEGFLDYFPEAIFLCAMLSKHGNDKHNPGEPLHWSRDKSDDHASCLMRHQLEWDAVDDDEFFHAVKVMWRACAQLQELIEVRQNLPPSKGSKVHDWDHYHKRLIEKYGHSTDYVSNHISRIQGEIPYADGGS